MNTRRTSLPPMEARYSFGGDECLRMLAKVTRAAGRTDGDFRRSIIVSTKAGGTEYRQSQKGNRI